VCATGCPETAIEMQAKQDFTAPPETRRDLKAAIKASFKQ
jgi:hypothetical protein